MSFEIKSYVTGARASRMLHKSTGDRPFTTGWVETWVGIVGVYMEPGLTSLVFVHGGREHRTWLKRSYAERALVSVCRRFANQVAQA